MTTAILLPIGYAYSYSNKNWNIDSYEDYKFAVRLRQAQHTDAERLGVDIYEDKWFTGML